MSLEACCMRLSCMYSMRLSTLWMMKKYKFQWVTSILYFCEFPFHLMFFEGWRNLPLSAPAVSNLKTPAFAGIFISWLAIMKGKSGFLAHGCKSNPLKKIMKTSFPLDLEFTVCNACLKALSRFSRLCITECDSSWEIKELLPSELYTVFLSFLQVQRRIGVLVKCHKDYTAMLSG